MNLLRAHFVPHPPLAVPMIGSGRELGIEKTLRSYRRIAESIAADKPELIIFITPHDILYRDCFRVSQGDEAVGDFGRFGVSQAAYKAKYDERFVRHLCITGELMKIPLSPLPNTASPLDHGVMVPMHFINECYTDYKIARISISGTNYETHYQLGQCLQKTLEGLNKRAVLVASGDLSHKLTADGPYGFAPEGPEFDALACGIMRSCDFSRLLELDEEFCEAAAECGLRSLIVLAGALDGLGVDSEFHSYEGPFGVGYAVSSFSPAGIDNSRHFLERFREERLNRINALRGKEDSYVRLARRSLEYYLSNGNILPAAELSDLPVEMLSSRAGVFVSLKKNGQLRGCIGTISPARDNIAEEIIHNAVSSGVSDPRFEAVSPEELPQLVYSVDVLSPAEHISSESELDVKKYGVIVSNGYRRGLLLPNLEGVDTVRRQVDIALQKAGIGANESYSLERFEVVRHT